MTSRSRRRLLGGTSATLAGLFLCGCLERTSFGTGSSTPTANLPALGNWVPKPESTNGRKHYLLSDAVFWNLDRIRSFEDALHPAFYDRLARVSDADHLGISPTDVDVQIEVASESASIYLGQFQTESITEALEQNGHTKDRNMGSFDIYVPGEYGYQRIVGVGDGTIVVGKGAGIQMAGDDDRTSQISPETVLENVIGAHRNDAERYAKTSEAFRNLTKSVQSFAAGTVRTFERVSTSTPEQLEFAGCVGTVDGFELSRPKSTYVLAFLFSDPSEAVVGPVEEQLERMSWLNEYDDVEYAVDGSTVTVQAKMANERFDGYLPGDPDDRARISVNE